MRGRDWRRSLGNLFVGTGLALLVLAGVVYFADPFGADRVLPGPVALAGEPTAVETGTATPVPSATPNPTGTALPTPSPTATMVPTPTPVPVKPGIPVHMTIPSIQVDSKVQETGTYWVDGEQYWQTLPWIVAHYETTAKVGADGNAVFAGHVTSQNAGNVFRDLYKIHLGDEIDFTTDDGRTISYVVDSVREVLPTDVSAMQPTPDPTVTLITCAGVWVPAEHQYTHRLIVSAKLKR